MITAGDLDAVLIAALPELAPDHVNYHRKRADDPEFTQTFFNYSFVPTLQAALDRQIVPFCERAFALIERLTADGDAEVRDLLREEFFGYGPACEKWMKRAGKYMGARTRELAAQESE